MCTVKKKLPRTSGALGRGGCIDRRRVRFGFPESSGISSRRKDPSGGAVLKRPRAGFSVVTGAVSAEAAGYPETAPAAVNQDGISLRILFEVDGGEDPASKGNPC